MAVIIHCISLARAISVVKYLGNFYSSRQLRWKECAARKTKMRFGQRKQGYKCRARSALEIREPRLDRVYRVIGRLKCFAVNVIQEIFCKLDGRLN